MGFVNPLTQNDMEIRPLRKDIKQFIRNHKLAKKWAKAKQFFEGDIRYPSLRAELLEPHWRGIYSFRLDKTYRALFFISESKAEVFQITKHYRKS